MSTSAILDAWRRLVPPCVAIAAGPILRVAPMLTAQEEMSAASMDARRRVEFATGRSYARGALSQLSYESVELPIGTDRAPVWPERATGSITHTDCIPGGHVAAAVAMTKLITRIGIDADADRITDVAVWKQFLREDELDELRRLPVAARSGAAAALWCLKEAAIKTADRPVDPTDIRASHDGFPLGSATPGAVDVWRIEFAGDPRQKPVIARTMSIDGLMLAAAMAGPAAGEVSEPAHSALWAAQPQGALSDFRKSAIQ